MTLDNNILTVDIAPQGAEPVSIRHNGREYLWNGDARFWNRHAPILFPVVGKPYRNELHIHGETLTMKQHGFARDSHFEELGDGRMRMVGNTNTQQYPYRFALEVHYRIDGSALVATWRVENQDTVDMYFQIGAHPGFMLPDYNPADTMHGYVRYYDRNGNPIAPVIVSALDDGNRVALKAAKRVPSEMPITAETFAHDALIFENQQVATAELCDKQGRRVLSVSCTQAEAYGIWAPHKEGCPFVCLEPWCGICDAKGFVGDIAERTYSHRLAPQESYLFTYTVQLY